ncbi:MAG: ABC transporter ATP-binding protein [Opitutae bacterium]|nr:ABC transporter ATP-binding protein [Opitutae bacterium]|tara:strand:- start:811 stop:2493 length:1683 start_codon:yes stop_codon:yes gene_type:complete
MGQLTIKNLEVSFHSREGTIHAVDGIDLCINPGEVVGLVGESGSGKSVTCNSILQLLPSPPAQFGKGKIEWSGKDLLQQTDDRMKSIRGKEISMIFQDPMSCLNPYLPVLDQVAEPLLIHGMCSPAEAKSKAMQMLVKVGVDRVTENPDSYPHEFSGGMRQRAMIAMALITEPSLLLADEPTTALDVTVQAKVLNILRELCSNLAVSVLFVSHDLGLVAELADRVVVMYRGKVVEQNETSAIFQNPQHPYVKALIACRPTLENTQDRLPTVEDFINPQPENQGESPVETEFSNSLKSGKVLTEAKSLVVEFTTNKGAVRAVDEVNLRINQGKTHGLVGESGSGKTTLGRALLNLVRKQSGEVLFHGNPISSYDDKKMMSFRKSMQIIFQDPYASLNPRLTIEQTLIEPMVVHQIGSSKKERRARVVALLEEVGLGSEHLVRYPHEFSGGQRQRICVARALTTEPEFIVCDECVSAMDVSVQAQVLNLLKALQVSRGLTYLFISHDLGVVKFMSDEISVMQKGQLIESGPANDIYNSPQTKYTQKLIQSIPTANRSKLFSF